MTEQLTDPWGVRGRVAVVTGASSGLGRHFAHVLATHGARVVAVARRADRLAELTAELADVDGAALRTVALDLRDRARLRAGFDDVLAAFGPVDILVNNAGVGVVKPALEHTDDDWDAAFDTNVRAAFELSRLVVTHRQGDVPISIVNLASPAATSPARDIAAYAASKAALVQLTRVLALEWARTGVRVNCLAPGHVPTELNPDLQDAGTRDALARRVPMGRLGEPRDLDAALLFLAGSVSSYVTGTVLPVDGGIGLRGA